MWQNYRLLTVLLPEFVTQRLEPDIASPIGLRPTAIEPRFVPSTLNFVTLDHDLCLGSTELFASEVMPALAVSLSRS